MSIEKKAVEKKFLVKNDDWKIHVYKSINFKQGYLGNHKGVCTRIRIEDDKAMIMIKSAYDEEQNMSYTYQIPIKEGLELLEQTSTINVIADTEHHLSYKDIEWEIYEFVGNNAGLIIAVVQLDEDADFPKPSWLGKEVSSDSRYYNQELIDKPYTTWNSLNLMVA